VILACAGAVAAAIGLQMLTGFVVGVIVTLGAAAVAGADLVEIQFAEGRRGGGDPGLPLTARRGVVGRHTRASPIMAVLNQSEGMIWAFLRTKRSGKTWHSSPFRPVLAQVFQATLFYNSPQ
jgi:hypothetical protein